MMNKFLFVFFVIIGAAGLIFQVEAGVFVGAALVPWELIKMNINKKITVGTLIICTAAGLIYFIIMGLWYLFGLLILIELYNLWGLYNIEKFTKNA